MSSTRRATDDSTFHQNKYASSPEFERGLSAKLVAKRVSVIQDRADRQLIWFLQYLSHQEGGLTAVSGQLLEKYPEKVATAAMLQTGKSENKNYTADEVAKIRLDMPGELRGRFPLKGETERELLKLTDPQAYLNARQADYARFLREAEENGNPLPYSHSDLLPSKRGEVKQHPSGYPASDFFNLCRKSARRRDESEMTALEKFLYQLCLDPACKLDAGGPWYFAGLVNALRDYQKNWTAANVAATVVTSLGAQVYEVLDYTRHSRLLSLTEGAARTGKSFAARAWCERQPGLARFVEVPTGNDDTGFFRALARGLCIGQFLQYKATDIRERVESVLLTGDLVLVLDEAQRLWPQRNLRYGFPSRIEWVMTMANAGVPIAMISTPQFTVTQKAITKAGWNAAQLIGRLGHYLPLPASLEIEDLMAVGKSALPEASKEVLRALAAYARTSARQLAAIQIISERAKYLASKSGRGTATIDDVREAMRASVIPADAKLASSLRQAGSGKTPAQAIVETTPQNLSRCQDREDYPVNDRMSISDLHIE